MPGRIWEVEVCGFNLLKRWQYPRDLVFGSTKRAKYEKVIRRFWKNNPFASSGSDKRSGGEAHAIFPKICGYLAMISVQLSRCPKRMTE